MPYVEGRRWGDREIALLQMMVEAVHEHSALAGIELTHSGHHAPNLYSRVPPLVPRSMGVSGFYPWQARHMDN